MSINKSLTILAGAVALAVSAGANAANTSQSIILNIVDTSNGNSVVFDTSLPTSATDPGAQSFNVGATSAYQSLIANETSSSDALVYSVVGYNTSNVVDTTESTTATPAPISGLKVAGAATSLSQFLVAVGNPGGGATYLPASTTPAAAQYTAQTDPTVAGNLQVTDLSAVGTAENFYAITATNAHATKNGFTVAELSSQWNLSSTGLLTYGSSVAPVPLPAPLVLLLSGLGLMGVVARRRQSAAV